MSEKLQKVLARSGLGSRRGIEQWIAEGRVSVNGSRAKLGDRVEPTDKIRVDGREVRIVSDDNARRRVILYYKKEGEVVTRSDPEGRPTVYDQLPRLKNERWVSIGRLDINTLGLLLFTTDGELANRLMHPSSQMEREYAVRVFGEVTPEHIQAVTEGVMLDDGLARFEQLKDAGGEGKNRWFHVTVKEGRYRVVRRLWESQGLQVSRLIRIRYGDVSLPKGMKEGQYIELSREEIDQLAASVRLDAKKHTGLYGRAKLRTERHEKKARRYGYMRRR